MISRYKVYPVYHLSLACYSVFQVFGLKPKYRTNKKAALEQVKESTCGELECLYPRCQSMQYFSDIPRKTTNVNLVSEGSSKYGMNFNQISKWLANKNTTQRLLRSTTVFLNIRNWLHQVDGTYSPVGCHQTIVEEVKPVKPQTMENMMGIYVYLLINMRNIRVFSFPHWFTQIWCFSIMSVKQRMFKLRVS